MSTTTHIIITIQDGIEFVVMFLFLVITIRFIFIYFSSLK